jgi:hypothetical protein
VAITVSELTGGTATTVSSQATASVSPGGNRLIRVTVHSGINGGTTPNQPTLTGNGLTYVAVDTQVFSDGISVTERLTVFRAMGESPSAGAITIDFAAQSQARVLWSVEEWDGVAVTGANGADAIVQSDPSEGASTSPAGALAAFGDAVNHACAISISSAPGGASVTLEGSFTAFTERSVTSSETAFLRTGYGIGENTTPSGTLGASTDWGVIAHEIADYVVPPPPDTIRRPLAHSHRMGRC